MIFRAVRSHSPWVLARMDAYYFCSAGTDAHERLVLAEATGVPFVPLGGLGGIGELTAPNRFTRVYASSAEQSVPYLRPYDVFDYIPQPADLLSVRRSGNLEELAIAPGQLLQSCSGRNLGPTVAVDTYLSRFALSHDMIRIRIQASKLRWYVLAFMLTPTGQAVIRRDKSGSVVDHISRSHIEQYRVPLLGDAVQDQASALMGRAHRLRQDARNTLASAAESIEARYPTEESRPTRFGWSVVSSSLGGRLDAAFAAPAAHSAKGRLQAEGGVELGTVADCDLPPRYTRYYVEAGHGRPILSGRQLLQARPVNLRYIADRSFKDVERYTLRTGWLALQAEGRAEERIGYPVVIASDRDGWLANNHIMRVIPHSGVSVGWLYSALSARLVQVQIKALSCGSVVDAVSPDDIRRVMLPPLDGGPDASDVQMLHWENLAKASALEDQAISLVERALDDAIGIHPTTK